MGLQTGYLLFLFSIGLYWVTADKDNGINDMQNRDAIHRECTSIHNVSSSMCTLVGTKYVILSEGESWWTHTIYRSSLVKYNYTGCCPGYSGSSCKPMCHGDSHDNACNRNEGHVVHKDGVITSCSGGTCVSPNTCEYCNTGYYADNVNGYCRECTPIANCNIPECTNGSKSSCTWCEGELVFNVSGYYAYTHHVDSEICMQACSWRPGTRCYPGTCDGDMLYPSQCTCADGFEGNDCATFSASAEDKLTLNKTQFVLSGSDTVVVPDPSSTDTKVWTKKVGWSTASIQVLASFDGPPIPHSVINKQTYIDFVNTKIGISNITIAAVLTRGNISTDWSLALNCSFKTTCNLTQGNVSLRSIPWINLLHDSISFSHGDTIRITFSLTNGGTVFYTNRENNAVESYPIRGRTVTSSAEFGFDLNTPTHCTEDTPSCGTQPLVSPDFLNQTTFEVTWDGWRDADSGLSSYRFEVFPLRVLNKSSGLLDCDGRPSSTTSTNASVGTAWLSVHQPGPYYVLMFASDKVGNEKSTRRIFFFDDQSVVSLQGNPPYVATADQRTNYSWINNDVGHVEVKWKNRFINIRHYENGWLTAVAPSSQVTNELDDTPGTSNRTNVAVHNVQGIIKFSVSYNISNGFNNTDRSVNPVTLAGPMIDQQHLSVKEDIKDGDQITFFIRGYDVMGEFAEDNVSAIVDLSPPTIENVWLSQGMHSKQKLNNVELEFEATDLHSGIKTVYWRIFDNSTHKEAVLGFGQVDVNAETDKQESCDDVQLQSSGCYCTPFNGCFDSHFRIVPHVTSTGHLSGTYFMEVRVVNNALLETTVIVKLCFPDMVIGKGPGGHAVQTP